MGAQYCETGFSSHNDSTYKLPIMFTKALVLCALASTIYSAPQLPPGIDAAACPNYPFCGPAPQAAVANPLSAALAAHAAAEANVRAQQAQGVGEVGASGNIGPSGLCGPTGCIAF